MHLGVTTLRPSEDLDTFLARMRHANTTAIMVSRSDGTIFGMVRS